MYKIVYIWNGVDVEFSKEDLVELNRIGCLSDEDVREDLVEIEIMELLGLVI
jgi:hypothetical protein